ncbi:alpha/beta-hydrolase [Epithele typhae]|uniref:alpha/beta-hydrolase n=1 Tax=Epithele typhae TaxID=378194 RepID=UPI002007B304|nr:alpha/beta-hydrolase [Epithele typhae]KAH9914897.1 alpha/beta-hydrolase [Epithele typhae]
MSTPLAKPCSDCCFRTFPHSGTAQGAFEPIAGVPTYVSAPPGDGPHAKVILFFSDVFGATYLAAQLAMDFWAAHGFLVLGIDYFLGDSVARYGWPRDAPDKEKEVWVTAKRLSAAPLVPPWLAEVRVRYGARVLNAGTGYCFGAPYVMDLLASDWVTAGAFAHPAFLDEDHFRNAKKPLLLSCPEEDFTFSLEARRRAEDILLARPEEHRAAFFIQVFSGARHSFATRPDPDRRTERWAKEESARSIVDWFNHHASET